MNKLNVIYEDNHIIVVEKQPNIPSQADKTEDLDMLTIIKDYLKEKYNKPGNVYLGLVHRLDRPVGGVMVFAKTSKAASRLSDQVREKIFKKKYLAVVDGKFEQKQGILEDYLYKDERNNMSKVVNKDKKNAKLAKLDYEEINELGNIYFKYGTIISTKFEKEQCYILFRANDDTKLKLIIEPNDVLDYQINIKHIMIIDITTMKLLKADIPYLPFIGEQ